MGGKYVITTEMSAKDTSTLTTEKVDIASALSFDQSFSYNQEEEKGNANQLLAQKREFSKPTCCGGNMTYPTSEELDATGLFGKFKKGMEPFSFSFGVQPTHKRSTSRSTRDMESVKSQITKQSVYTLGGLPPSDANNWAT